MCSPCPTDRLLISESLDDTVPAIQDDRSSHYELAKGNFTNEDEAMTTCRDSESDSGHESIPEHHVPAPSAFRPLPPSNPSIFQQQFYALLAAQLNQSPFFPSTTVSIPEHSVLPTERRREQRSVSREGSCRTVTPSSCTDSPMKGEREVLDYAERRRRNNDSARRSREIRRQREQENRMKSEVLERENVQLRNQIGSLQMELSQLTLLLLQKGAAKMT